jgi:hypothetical protein
LIQRIVFGVTALAAIAAAAGVVIVAAAFALYALAEPSLGSAGAAGLVALAAALLIALVAIAAWWKMRPPSAHPGKAPPQGDMLARAVNLARERPIIAAGGIVAAGMIAMRNPALTALVVKSFLDSKKPPRA